jgi:RND family efflux transporter MFP subunit
MLNRSVTALVLTSSVLVGCNKAEPWPEEPTSRPVKLMTVIVGEQSFERRFPATVEAGDKASISFRVAGRIEDILVKSGESVEKDQLIAALMSDEAALILAEKKAQFQLADVQFQRAKALIKDNVISEQDYDDAVGLYKAASSQYEQAKTNYDYTQIVAPFDGNISLTFVEDHQWVSANQPVLNIQSAELLKVEFQLPDYLLSGFQANPPEVANVRFDSLPDSSYPVTFLELDTQSDASTGSYKVTMAMQRPEDSRIFPGMSGQLEVEIPQGTPNALPQSALFECADKQCVWQIDGEGGITQVEVTLTERGEVLTGLADGDQIVATGVDALTADMKVREWIKEQGI